MSGPLKGVPFSHYCVNHEYSASLILANADIGAFYYFSTVSADLLITIQFWHGIFPVFDNGFSNTKLNYISTNSGVTQCTQL